MAIQPLPRLTLVLGGARSGKSRFAERLIEGCGGPALYIATAEPFDDEMRARIAEHKARRDGRWRTIDAPHDLAAVLKDAAGRTPVLVDCLTLWLSNLMMTDRDVEAASRDLLSELAVAPGPLVLVSNEVGLGIVPDNALARRFRDAQGRLNARIAEIADRVVLMAAGLPLTLKEIHAQKG